MLFDCAVTCRVGKLNRNGCATVGATGAVSWGKSFIRQRLARRRGQPQGQPQGPPPRAPLVTFVSGAAIFVRLDAVCRGAAGAWGASAVYSLLFSGAPGTPEQRHIICD
jgi:hypothetical protein